MQRLSQAPLPTGDAPTWPVEAVTQTQGDSISDTGAPAKSPSRSSPFRSTSRPQARDPPSLAPGTALPSRLRGHWRGEVSETQWAGCCPVRGLSRMAGISAAHGGSGTPVGPEPTARPQTPSMTQRTVVTKAEPGPEPDAPPPPVCGGDGQSHPAALSPHFSLGVRPARPGSRRGGAYTAAPARGPAAHPWEVDPYPRVTADSKVLPCRVPGGREGRHGGLEDGAKGSPEAGAHGPCLLRHGADEAARTPGPGAGHVGLSRE